MNSINLLSVRNLSIKLKDGTKLVDNSSFNIPYGNCLGIIGESGSGKSLTCKAIMGVLHKKKFNLDGKILFDNKDLLHLNNKQMNNIRGNDLSLIMQNPMTAFNPVFKIGNQVIETLRAHTDLSKNEAYKIAIKHLKKTNLPRVEEIMNSYPHTLSGGMLQRVMIAISLMLNPKLIIADEATTALDVSTQAVILDEFKRIKDSGISMLMVSHDFGVVSKLADNIIVMKDGKIVEKGTTKEILTNPNHRYTKELIKASRLLKDGVRLC